MSARIAAAYLRRSSVTGDRPGDASREAQEAAVRRLCGDDVVLYVDWGITGSGKRTRPEYDRLKADIAAGKVGSVCAYSLSRLGRSTKELLAFVELCTSNGVTVATAVGQSIRPAPWASCFNGRLHVDVEPDRGPETAQVGIHGGGIVPRRDGLDHETFDCPVGGAEPGEFTPNIVGHFILGEDGTVGASAAECPACRVRLAGLGDEPTHPGDDLPF
jgi:hypothetical protein